ncbi:hypothetical protein GOP47_0008948 [Adiantum capillus-veneris]|uniref:Allene oxide synthase n=1 Tax=Adiantum capillus-veneris TaxID=13818 RepID=A0A9D4ZIH9_ADICA|nr:hypothetical protein GOP47_0008948 [Adiantum capillus-veneris]
MASSAAAQLQSSLSFQLSELRVLKLGSASQSKAGGRSSCARGRPRNPSTAGKYLPPQATETSSRLASSTVELPPQEIPGSYGPPFIGLAVDKLNYFVVQGRDEFFLSLMQRYKSTVIRVNMPPGPPLFPDSRTIMLLDQKSIRVLFDTSKVEKKDVFAGTYMPSTDFTGGFRVLPYLDPSEPKHAPLKDFCFKILQSNGRKFLPEFHTAFDEGASEWDAQLDAKGEAEFTSVCQNFTLSFLCRAILDADPSAPGSASLRDEGPSLIQAWIAAQLAPQASLGLPKPVEALLHTIPLPFSLVSNQYNKVYQFFYTNGHHLLDIAEQEFGLDRAEACHNLLFFVCFNTWGGLQLFLPAIFQRIASAGVSFQKELAQEVRSAVGEGDEVTMKALQSMKLVHSTVYEVLRMDPPVPFQYGRAKDDMIVESHDAAYKVRKGELLGCYQKIAMRDPKVFEAPQTFKPKRFMGAEGERLLQNVTWSNGPETEEPTLSNKQCAGKDFVNLMARLLIAEIYLRYDFFKLGKVEQHGARSSFGFKVLKRRRDV